MPDNIDIRITLSLLLSDEDKTDEAVALLSPPKSSGVEFTKMFDISWCSLSLLFYDVAEFQSYNTPNQQKPWWHDGKVKMQLAKIYYNKGKLEKFVDTIFLTVLETLNIEHENRKVHTFFQVQCSCIVWSTAISLSFMSTDLTSIFHFNAEALVNIAFILFFVLHSNIRLISTLMICSDGFIAGIT